MICLQYTWGFKDYFACDDMKQIYNMLCISSVNNVDILSIDKGLLEWRNKTQNYHLRKIPNNQV